MIAADKEARTTARLVRRVEPALRARINLLQDMIVQDHTIVTEDSHTCLTVWSIEQSSLNADDCCRVCWPFWSERETRRAALRRICPDLSDDQMLTAVGKRVAAIVGESPFVRGNFEVWKGSEEIYFRFKHRDLVEMRNKASRQWWTP